MKTEKSDLSPMFAQYRAAKARHPGAILLFHCGDFYETYWEDAERIAALLGVALTHRTVRGDRIPMAGVPVRNASTYVRRLLDAGERVALCDQVEDSAEAKELIERRVVRIVTPGTIFEEDLLVASEPNFLLAVLVDGDEAGLAWADISTGRMEIQDLPPARLPEAILRIAPSEAVLPDPPDPAEAPLRALLAERKVPAAAAPRAAFGAARAEEALRELLGAAALGGFGFEPGRPSLGAAGGLVAYLRETQVRALPPIADVRRLAEGDRLILDGITLRNLEVLESSATRGREGSLLALLDRTETAMGARALKEWIAAPPRRPADVGARQEAVEALRGDAGRLRAVRAGLSRMPDLERLAVRAATERAAPRELGAIREALRRLPGIRAAALPAAPALGNALPPEALEDLEGLLSRALEDELPLAVGDGPVVRAGFDPEIDRLRAERHGAVQWIASLEAQESKRLGIPSLKVGFNEIHGYFLEVPNAHRARVPPDYSRKGGVKNAERWATPELRQREVEVARARDRIASLEREAFVRIRREAGAARARLLAAAGALGRLDAAASLAAVAAERGWVRPEVVEEPVLDIREGRHPVLDAALPAGAFIPNDVSLDARSDRFVILTGPNMAGKSTYIRQVALLSLLAHAGSWVPAAAARVGWIDRIFSRVGAQDDLFRGRSTFLVEMEETAHILRHASDRSLVILDEVGRGTSTYDGVAIAWAVTEHLLERTRARCLFATHYHELTRLASEKEGARNFHVAVRELPDRILFLHRILAGGTDRSYGVQVATLAGLPAEVVERATALLALLESGRRGGPAGKPEPAPQRSLFG